MSSKKKGGGGGRVTSLAVHIGGAKVTLTFANYIICHFGATLAPPIRTVRLVTPFLF